MFISVCVCWQYYVTVGVESSGRFYVTKLRPSYVKISACRFKRLLKIAKNYEKSIGSRLNEDDVEIVRFLSFVTYLFNFR